MINCKSFLELLEDNYVNFFTGVPDSLLKTFCAYLSDKYYESSEHIIAANEGNAIALASGYNLATGKMGLVYLQNSGLGNIVNPLLSLADKDVYSVPMMIMVGWRGEPGVKDEPQHVKQGKVTLPMLESMGVRYEVLDTEFDNAESQVLSLLGHAKNESEPVVIVVKKDTFDSYKPQRLEEDKAMLEREEAIDTVTEVVGESPLIFSTTGKISRELYESRVLKSKVECSDFLNVGAMGHVSQLALATALQLPEKRVLCYDGDGAFLMHMGGAATIGSLKPSNYVHFVFNNSAHESVGGQPTIASKISLTDIAKACGYKKAKTLNTIDEIQNEKEAFLNEEGPIFYEIIVRKGARSDLGRPKSTPLENKMSFVKKIQES